MYLTLLNLLCLSISLISSQITYPDMRQSRCGRITEVGLYLYFSFHVGQLYYLIQHNTSNCLKEKEPLIFSVIVLIKSKTMITLI